MIFDDDRGFSDALTYSAARLGFSARLIEKDYYCSLLLRDLRELHNSALVFKGGTLLSKVYADFYRLSEDLDFMISMDAKASRPTRRAAIGSVKDHLAQLADRLECFQCANKFSGANANSHYSATYFYRSRLTGEDERIQVEVSLREPVIEPCEEHPARTILLDPDTGDAALEPIMVTALTFRETYAEKIRAALCRQPPAIRDLYDVEYAVGSGSLDFGNEKLLVLVGRKVAIPGMDTVDVSAKRLESLRQQVEAHLRPVLKEEDVPRFDVERAFERMVEIVKRLR